MKIQHIYPSLQKQRGAASLVIAVVLLFALTLITVYAAQIGVTEQRISANDYRSKQALENAQAALEAGITNFSELWFAGVGSTTVNIGGFMVTAAAIDGDTSLARLSATGNSDDGSAISTVSQLVKRQPLLPFPPPSPMIAAGTISFSGSSLLENQRTGIAAWSGGEIGCSGSANVSVANTEGSIPCDGLGLCGGDSSLAGLVSGSDTSNFYSNFFAYGLDELPAVTAHDSAELADYISDGERIIIFDAAEDVMFDDAVIGSVDEPVILIVKGGGIKLMGDSEFYGLIYTEYDSGLFGSSVIHGAMISTGNLHAMGNSQADYNTNVIDNLTGGGPGTPSVNARVAGSWRDF